MDINLARVFVKVIQNGSFSKAASILRMPNSSVSKAIAKLERDTGAKLIIRTTRSLTLTDTGRDFYSNCLGPITQLEDATKSLSGADSSMIGHLKITAPEDVGQFVVGPAIARLSRIHPQLRFDVEFRNDVVDLIKDGFDLAVRVGSFKDSSLKFKKAGAIALLLVASPEFVRTAKKIKHPRDLAAVDCLSLNYEGLAKTWNLKSGTERAKVEIAPKILANQMTSLLQMTLVGGGICLLPSYLCLPYIEDGRLVRLLPEWSSPTIPLSIMTPLAPSSSARLKATVDFLADALSKSTPQE